MAPRSSWILLVAICIVLLGSCSLMAGDFEQWPASVPALGVMIAGKFANDRFKLVKWPMEFILWSAIVLIFFNLVYLYFKEY